MDSDRREDSGEMYSQTTKGSTHHWTRPPNFPCRGCPMHLQMLGKGQEEYAMMLEVMMADCPGRPHSPTFSWNAGMVMHVLKSDPVLRELEHV